MVAAVSIVEHGTCAMATSPTATAELVDDYRPKRGGTRRLVPILGGSLAVLASAAGFLFWWATATPAEIRPAGADYPGAMPVAAVVPEQPVTPADYAVVSLFQDEAILAAGDMLLRVKVGSTAPGLGTIRAIEPDGQGGTIVTDAARLTLAAAPAPDPAA
jgi:hypothetical protein